MLTRQSQMGISIQTDEATPSTIVAADCAGSNKDHSHEYGFEFYDREITRATLTPLGKVPAARMLTIKRTDECVGGGAALASDATWHRNLRAAGMNVAQLKKLSVGSRSGGEFAVGDIVGNNASLGSATATGRLAYIKTGGSDLIVFLPLTGTFSGSDTIYNYATSQVSASASGSLANAGHAFTPITETEAAAPPCVTVERRQGGEVHRIESGRGKFTLSMEWSKPALVMSEIMGPCKLDATTGRPTAASAIANVPAAGTQPLVCLGTTFKVGAKSPVVTKCEITVDNTVAMRKTIGPAVLSSGYAAARIGNRSITVKIDPEVTPSADTGAAAIDIIGSTAIGTVMPVLCQAGSPTHANGLLVAYIPAAQITENPSLSDRDGIVTSDVTLTATGTADDELFIFHVFP